VLFAAALGLSGCARWNYDRIQLGQDLRDPARLLPEQHSRVTRTGLCYIERDLTGKTEVIVVLVTRDRRIYAKLQATHLQRDLGWQAETGYTLDGEIDPDVAGFEETGPIDMLRFIADDLTVDHEDSFTTEAHGWIAAGLVRLIQRWPQGVDEGPAFPRLTEALARVPGGGEAGLRVDANGRLRVTYSQGAKW
jgi:hypothetical protein